MWFSTEGRLAALMGYTIFELKLRKIEVNLKKLSHILNKFRQIFCEKIYKYFSIFKSEIIAKFLN